MYDGQHKDDRDDRDAGDVTGAGFLNRVPTLGVLWGLLLGLLYGNPERNPQANL